MAAGPGVVISSPATAQLLLIMGGFTAGVLFTLLTISANNIQQATTTNSTKAGCSLTMDGESSQSLMLTSVGETTEISVSGLGTCELTFLVVGGGGHEDVYSSGGAGGYGGNTSIPRT